MRELNDIVLCGCGRPEYRGDMRWISGKQYCRNCYKEKWEAERSMPYTWHDLDGIRPTMEEYNRQIEEGI